MDPISKLVRAFAVARRGAPSRKLSELTSPPANTSPTQALSRRVTDAQLRVDVAGRLRSIRSGGENWRHDAARVVIERVLLREFGNEVLSSGRLVETVNNVQRVMEADPEVRAELNSLIDELTGDTPAKQC